MTSTKTSSEGQMGSGESDDEFYNVKMQNTSTVNKTKETKNESPDKVNSPPRPKVKYDYKFDSSSDDDSDESGKESKKDSKPKETRDELTEEKKKDDTNDKAKLPQNTSKVVEKINEELKSMKNVAVGSKTKVENKSDVTPTTSTKHIPTTSVGVTPPVVVVPPAMIVPQSHSVMAGMIVPPAIGLANQNVMIPQANMLNLSGNVIRGANAIMGTPMGIANPSLINQGNLVGMTNDILQLQGNLMGIAAPGNMMQIPAGLCMTGIPVQSNLAALQGNLIGAAGNIMANQTILNNQGSIITNPGGVIMNPANVMTVNALMNNQGTLMGNPGNIMLNMNSLVGGQAARMNYPGSMLNSVRNVTPEIGKSHYSSEGKSSEKDWKGLKSQCDKGKYTSSKSPSPSDSGDGNEEEDEEDGTSTSNVRETANTFKNDGSFMEMFKKMSEANNVKGSSNKDESSSTDKAESESRTTTTTTSASSAAASAIANMKKPPVVLSGIVGKRRGGRVLKTGLVKKVKKENEADEEKGPKDAWAMYMAEVKKYREASCEEEGKTRPLVK